MGIMLPDIDRRLGLGVGLDMPWGDAFGFNPTTDAPQDQVSKFISKYKTDFNFGFISCHRRDRGKLRPEKFIHAYQAFFDQAPHFAARALHHTFLNLASMERYEKKEICQFTNVIARHLNLKWINEDLGIWSIRGKTLPYPLPPFFTRAGLKACVDNIREYQAGLEVPLLVEFPGFTDGMNFHIGTLHAYDFFTEIVEKTDVAVTLDTGHLISYQWLLGKRKEALFKDLQRLPLEHCFEIHLSGCQIVGNRFMDFHHGVLLDEQITLLEVLSKKCPNLKAITYEDPKFDGEGTLILKAQRNYEHLKAFAQRWCQPTTTK